MRIVMEAFKDIPALIRMLFTVLVLAVTGSYMVGRVESQVKSNAVQSAENERAVAEVMNGLAAIRESLSEIRTRQKLSAEQAEEFRGETKRQMSRIMDYLLRATPPPEPAR